MGPMRKSAVRLWLTVFAAGLIGGCSMHLRYYDDYRHDYHRWGVGEDEAYHRYWRNRHEQYRDFDRLNRDEQREYWRWRHDHPGAH